MEGVRYKMLKSVDLVMLIREKTVQEIANDFILPKNTVQKEINRQLGIRLRSEYNEFKDPLLNKTGAWINSKERLSLINFKNNYL